MDKERLCYGDNGLDGIGIPELNPFETDMCFFGGLTQNELEEEVDGESPNTEENTQVDKLFGSIGDIIAEIMQIRSWPDIKDDTSIGFDYDQVIPLLQKAKNTLSIQKRGDNHIASIKTLQIINLLSEIDLMCVLDWATQDCSHLTYSLSEIHDILIQSKRNILFSMKEVLWEPEE